MISKFNIDEFYSTLPDLSMRTLQDDVTSSLVSMLLGNVYQISTAINKLDLSIIERAEFCTVQSLMLSGIALWSKHEEYLVEHPSDIAEFPDWDELDDTGWTLDPLRSIYWFKQFYPNHLAPSMIPGCQMVLDIAYMLAFNLFSYGVFKHIMESFQDDFDMIADQPEILKQELIGFAKSIPDVVDDTDQCRQLVLTMTFALCALYSDASELRRQLSQPDMKPLLALGAKYLVPDGGAVQWSDLIGSVVEAWMSFEDVRDQMDLRDVYSWQTVFCLAIFKIGEVLSAEDC